MIVIKDVHNMYGKTGAFIFRGIKSVISACVSAYLLLYAGCGEPHYGSETTNERTAVVYMPDGVTRAAGADVSINVSGKDSACFSGTTDGNGTYIVPLLPDNMYTVNIEKKVSDSTLLVSFQDSAYISYSLQTVKNDTLKYPCDFSGLVRLQSFDQYKQNYLRISVQVLGTTKFCNVDSAGRFDLRNLAKGVVYNLRIHSGIQGYSDYYPEIGPSYQNRFSDTFDLPYSGIPPVTISELKFQPLTGTAFISWNPSKIENLLGYRVYRYNFTKVDSSVVPVAFIKDTVMSDTLYSATAYNSQYLLTDMSSYQIAYRVSAVTQQYEESAFYLNPNNMIVIVSPYINKIKTEWAICDSITKQKMLTAAVNRTAMISVKAANTSMPVDSIEYVNLTDNSLAAQIKLARPAMNYEGLLYMKWSSPGVKRILVRYIDSSGLCSSYNSDTISIEVTDINLRVENVLTIPEVPIASKPFVVKTVVRNIGTTALVNTNIPVLLTIDTSFSIRKNILIQEFKPGDTVSVNFDSTEIACQLPGVHSMSIIADDSNMIAESDESDNIKSYSVEYTDVDLLVGKIFFDSSEIMEGDRVACGAYIHNSGSTDYRAEFNARVDFCIDGHFFCWGYLLEDIKAHDSVKVFGISSSQAYAYWYATKGRHSIIVSVDSTSAVNESDEKNNKKYDTLSVSDFNLKILDFRALVDTITQNDIEFKSSIEIQGEWLKTYLDSIPLQIKYTCSDTVIHSYDTIIKNCKPGDTIDIVRKIAGTGILDSSAGKYSFDMYIDPDRKLSETCYTDNYEPCFMEKSNITFNGFMEDGSSDLSISGWNTKEDSTGAVFRWEDAGKGIGGSRCISIESSGFNHATWYFRAKILQGKSYRFTGWVKGENIQIREESSSIPVTLGCRGSIPVKIGEYGTFDWVYFDEIITNETSDDNCFIDCNLGLGSSPYYASGKVYFDNLRLQLVGK